MVFDGNVRRRGSGVNPGYLSYPERYYKYELTVMYGTAYRQGINNTGAPMKSLPTLAAAAALFLGFSAPASASGEPVKYATVRNWEIYSNGTYCTANAKYENGSSLQFNFDTEGRANIAIWNSRWKIPKGTYQVVVAVDRTPPKTFRAEADGYYVMMPWELNEEQINIMSNGVVFRATVGRELYEYSLAGSREMMHSLGRCVADLSPSSADPFSTSPPAARAETPASTDTPSNPFRRL